MPAGCASRIRATAAASSSTRRCRRSSRPSSTTSRRRKSCESEEREPDDGLHVGDLAAPDHFARVLEGEGADFDVLVLVQFRRFGGNDEAGGTEEEHLLVTVAGR